MQEYLLGTDPHKISTAGDGIPDGDADWDHDGITNHDEFALGLNPKNTATAATAVTITLSALQQ